MRERRFGVFERALRIRETVDTDKIEASFENGVLAAMLPKTAEAQRRVEKCVFAIYRGRFRPSRVRYDMPNASLGVTPAPSK